MVYGFIGLGNMAGAIIRGMYKSGAFENDTILGFNRSEEKTLKLKEETGLVPCQSESETAEKSDVVILAVKPQMLPAVLPKIVPVMNKDKLLISIAAGKNTNYYEEILGTDGPVVRIMPNINAKVGISFPLSAKYMSFLRNSFRCFLLSQELQVPLFICI